MYTLCIRGVQRNPLPIFAVLQVSTAQNSLYQSEIMFQGGMSWTPTVIFGVALFCYFL